MKKVINRRTFITANSKLHEAVALLIEASQGSPYKHRIYSSHYGPFDTVVLEVEFESMAQMETAWAEFFAQQERGDFSTKWQALTVPGGTNELWLLEAEG